MHFDFVVSKLTRSEAIDKLKEYMPDYEKNKDVYDSLLDKRPEAIKNAKKLIEMHKTNEIELISVESNPLTQVNILVEEILKITAII